MLTAQKTSLFVGVKKKIVLTMNRPVSSIRMIPKNVLKEDDSRLWLPVRSFVMYKFDSHDRDGLARLGVTDHHHEDIFVAESLGTPASFGLLGSAYDSV